MPLYKSKVRKSEQDEESFVIESEDRKICFRIRSEQNDHNDLLLWLSLILQHQHHIERIIDGIVIESSSS